MRTSTPYFSIVIPALNEEKYLPLLLKDLTEQTDDSFEVIVVDGKSDDKTVKKAQAYEKKLPLTILSSPQRNVSLQRNLGAKKARGEWVIFMDADNRLPTYFLDGLKYQVLKNDKVDLFTTYVKVESKQPLDKAIENMVNLGVELSKIMGNPQGFGALIGCKKEVLTKVSFNENQKILEDSLFLKEASQQGFTFDVIKEPAFIYSLRRIRKEGTLKIVRATALMQLKYLMGNTMDSDSFYPMLGGSYYEAASHREPFLDSVHDFLKSASKKQLDNARKILSSLKEM